MAVTITLFDHTARRFAEGANIAADTYKVALYTAATFDSTATTLAGVTKTEVLPVNGYTAGGQALVSVSITTVGTNGAKFDANDVIWSASGGSITASYAIIYNDTDTDDPPLAFIDFGGEQSAGDGTDFLIAWDSSGILVWTVA